MSKRAVSDSLERADESAQARDELHKANLKAAKVAKDGTVTLYGQVLGRVWVTRTRAAMAKHGAFGYYGKPTHVNWHVALPDGTSIGSPSIYTRTAAVRTLYFKHRRDGTLPAAAATLPDPEVAKDLAALSVDDLKREVRRARAHGFSLTYDDRTVKHWLRFPEDARRLLGLEWTYESVRPWRQAAERLVTLHRRYLKKKAPAKAKAKAGGAAAPAGSVYGSRPGTVAAAYKQAIMDGADDATARELVTRSHGRDAAGPRSYPAWYRSWLTRRGFAPPR